MLTEGAVNPHDVLAIKGPLAVQDYLIQEVQRVYRMQGVDINDKHIEVIVRQMMRKCRVEDAGSTDLITGSLIAGKAKLSCIGRDIEYRELSLERNVENVWEMVADSRTQPELLGDRITYLVSELMRDRTKFIGTPTELSEKIDPVGMERISPKKVSRLILQSLDALSKIGIFGMVRRSNGKRLIELRRAESDDAQGVPVVAPVDPVGALCGDLREIAGHGE